jgi:hypothetical protein
MASLATVLQVRQLGGNRRALLGGQENLLNLSAGRTAA